MNIILVTSDVTYVPDNYNDVLTHILAHESAHIAGVVLVKINILPLIGKVMFLYLTGCHQLATTLLRNTLNALAKSKEALLQRNKIPYLQVKDVNDVRTIAWLQKMQPEMVINLRARCIYNQAVLDIPKLACVNLHHGILPEQRGLFCDLYAIAEGSPAGFSIHKMTSSVDQGEIYYQEVVASNTHYMRYLQAVADKEKQAITTIIATCSAKAQLPKGAVKTSSKPKVTSTPNLKTIQLFQKKGIVL
ncbi:MAG: formyltransferase family protein [bacterium]